MVGILPIWQVIAWSTEKEVPQYCMKEVYCWGSTRTLDIEHREIPLVYTVGGTRVRPQAEPCAIQWYPQYHSKTAHGNLPQCCMKEVCCWGSIRTLDIEHREIPIVYVFDPRQNHEQYNEIHDITAKLLTEISYNVATEPLLHPLLMSHLLISQPTQNQIVALISVLEVFGTQAKTHFSMLWLSTPKHQPTVPWPCTTAAYWKCQSTKSREYARSWSGTCVSHPSSSQQRVEWAAKLQYSTRDWRTESPGKNKMNVWSSRDGFAVISLLQSSALLS